MLTLFGSRDLRCLDTCISLHIVLIGDCVNAAAIPGSVCLFGWHRRLTQLVCVKLLIELMPLLLAESADCLARVALGRPATDLSLETRVTQSREILADETVAFDY